MYEIIHKGETSTLTDGCNSINIVGDYMYCEREDTKICFKTAVVLSFIDDHKKQKPVIIKCDNCGRRKQIVGEKPTIYMCDNCIDIFIDYIGRNGGIVELLKKHKRGR